MFLRNHLHELWTTELDYKTNKLYYFKVALKAEDNLLSRFITCPVCNNIITKKIGDWLYPGTVFVGCKLHPCRGWLIESSTEITKDELYEHFGWSHKKTKSKSNSIKKTGLIEYIKNLFT